MAKRKATTPAERYKPPEAEMHALKAYRANLKERTSPPRVRVERSEDGVFQVSPDHPEQAVWMVALQGAVGTDDQSLTAEHLSLLFNAVTHGQEMSEAQCNAALATLHGIAPRDEIEGMLAAQMVAVHHAAMTMARRLNNVDTIDQQNSASNALNKLSRTYAALLEALNRHRGKGQQKVTVEHVHVHSGGQAVVGVVEPLGGGDRQKLEDQPHAKAIAHAPCTPLRSPDADGDAVSIAGCEGAPAV